MANGNPFANALVRFGAAFEDPEGFARRRQQQSQFEQRLQVEQQGVRRAAAQAALERLPIDHPARAKAQSVLDAQGIGFLGQALQPQIAAPRAEDFTLPAGARRFRPTPEGRAELIAEGAQPVRRQEARFGTGAPGRAMDFIIKARAKQRQGIPLTEEEKDELAFSRQTLEAPRIIRGPGGELIQASPVGIPERLQSLFDEAPRVTETTPSGTPVQSFQQQVADGQFKLKTLKESGKKGQDFEGLTQSIFAKIGSTIDALKKGRKEFGGVTGPVGSLKATFGGAARSVGIPVPETASGIRRNLETIKLLAAEPVFQQTSRSLSNQDLQRLDKIIGTVDALTDETEIRAAMLDLLELIEIMQNARTTNR